MGFVVRPFGALFFGRIGDLVGRKYAFLVTLSIMGGATALIGFLPTYANGWLVARRSFCSSSACCRAWRWAANMAARRFTWPSTCPMHKRGFYTSFIQITATLGLFVSLTVILSYAAIHEQGSLSGLGLAHSVPHLHLPGQHFALHPLEDERVADLHADQERGDDFRAASERSIWQSGKTSSAC